MLQAAIKELHPEDGFIDNAKVEVWHESPIDAG